MRGKTLVQIAHCQEPPQNAPEGLSAFLFFILITYFKILNNSKYERQRATEEQSQK